MDTDHSHSPPSHHRHVDTEVYFDGRLSILTLLHAFIKVLFPAGVAFLAWYFVDDNTELLNLFASIENLRDIDWEPILANPLVVFDRLRHDPSFQPILVIVFWLFGLFSCSRVLYALLVWLSTRYRITNDRIEYERGIISKTVLNVELWRVRDLNFRRSVVHFVLGLGVIDIVATDETISKLTIGPIRGAREVYDKLKQARLKSGRSAGAQAVGMV